MRQNAILLIISTLSFSCFTSVVAERHDLQKRDNLVAAVGGTVARPPQTVVMNLGPPGGAPQAPLPPPSAAPPPPPPPPPQAPPPQGPQPSVQSQPAPQAAPQPAPQAPQASIPVILQPIIKRSAVGMAVEATPSPAPEAAAPAPEVAAPAGATPAPMMGMIMMPAQGPPSMTFSLAQPEAAGSLSPVGIAAGQAQAPQPTVKINVGGVGAAPPPPPAPAAPPPMEAPSAQNPALPPAPMAPTPEGASPPPAVMSPVAAPPPPGAVAAGPGIADGAPPAAAATTVNVNLGNVGAPAPVALTMPEDMPMISGMAEIGAAAPQQAGKGIVAAAPVPQVASTVTVNPNGGAGLAAQQPGLQQPGQVGQVPNAASVVSINVGGPGAAPNAGNGLAGNAGGPGSTVTINPAGAGATPGAANPNNIAAQGLVDPNSCNCACMCPAGSFPMAAMAPPPQAVQQQPQFSQPQLAQPQLAGPGLQPGQLAPPAGEQGVAGAAVPLQSTFATVASSLPEAQPLAAMLPGPELSSGGGELGPPAPEAIPPGGIPIPVQAPPNANAPVVTVGGTLLPLQSEVTVPLLGAKRRMVMLGHEPSEPMVS